MSMSLKKQKTLLPKAIQNTELEHNSGKPLTS